MSARALGSLVLRPAARWLPGAVFVGGCLLALELAVAAGRVSPTVAPAPSQVAVRLAALIGSGEVVAPLRDTLSILAMGWIGASAAGVLLGLLMGYFRAVYVLLEPLVELIRPVPKPALIPPLMLLLGLGPATQVAIVFLGAFFPVLINTVQGARGVDPVAVDVGRTFRVGTARILWRIVLPAALPMILSGMKVSLSLALVLVVLSEMLVGASGLGAIIIDLQRLFRVQDMYAWVAVLAALGLVLVLGFEWLERRIVFWQSSR